MTWVKCHWITYFRVIPFIIRKQLFKLAYAPWHITYDPLFIYTYIIFFSTWEYYNKEVNVWHTFSEYMNKIKLGNKNTYKNFEICLIIYVNLRNMYTTKVIHVNICYNHILMVHNHETKLIIKFHGILFCFKARML